MLSTNTEKRTPAPIYKEASDKLRATAVSKDISEKIILLEDVQSRGRVDLQDTELVKQVAADYLSRCQQSGSIPTVMALSAALGVSRQWLNRFCAENATHPTARYIEVLKEIFADCLTQAGFGRYVSESLTIFILKNCASMADRVELEAVANNSPMGDTVNQSELERRIAGSVVLDDCDE